MSVLIKGMKMPKDCFTCPFMYRKRPQPEVWCTANEDEWIDIRNVHGDARHELCPLVELSPHGRLIDGDALLGKITYTKDGMKYVDKVLTASKEELRTALINIPLCINNAPTIIEAEAEDD